MPFSRAVAPVEYQFFQLEGATGEHFDRDRFEALFEVRFAGVFIDPQTLQIKKEF